MLREFDLTQMRLLFMAALAAAIAVAVLVAIAWRVLRRRRPRALPAIAPLSGAPADP